MYKHKIIFIVLALLVLPALASAQFSLLSPLTMEIPSGSLTLKQAQRLALKASPSVQQAAARIEAAMAVVDQARSILKPHVSIRAGRRYQNSTAQPDWAPETRSNESYHSTTAGIEANWLLFDGFSSQAGILAAKHEVEASQQTLDETRRLLAEAVSSVFYQAQLAVESMLIAQQNQVFNRTLEDEANKRWLAGTIPEAEKLNFSVKALQAETDFLEAQQSFKLVTTVLAELLALNDAKLPSELCPIRSNENLLEEEIPEYAIEFSYALEQRPDLQAIQASIAALEQNEKAQRGRYLPKLTLNTGFDYTTLNDMNTEDQEEHDAYVGLNLSWDLYQGGNRSAQIRETQSNIRALRQQHQQQVLAIQSAIQQAIASAEATKAMYQRQQQSLLLTERIREHIEKAYRAGVANLTRLNEAQTDLVRAAGAEASSRINYLLALQQLQAASGRILQF
ncbi:MAG: TolC family protein [Deltaproteobacteria bacterium]|nr:TolC family protein [Deltaproteobacteria bacterium]